VDSVKKVEGGNNPRNWVEESRREVENIYEITLQHQKMGSKVVCFEEYWVPIHCELAVHSRQEQFVCEGRQQRMADVEMHTWQCRGPQGTDRCFRNH